MQWNTGFYWFGAPQKHIRDGRDACAYSIHDNVFYFRKAKAYLYIRLLRVFIFNLMNACYNALQNVAASPFRFPEHYRSGFVPERVDCFHSTLFPAYARLLSLSYWILHRRPPPCSIPDATFLASKHCVYWTYTIPACISVHMILNFHKRFQDRTGACSASFGQHAFSLALSFSSHFVRTHSMDHYR